MREADTYRAARRNAAKGQVWGPGHYIEAHVSEYRKKRNRPKPKPKSQDQRRRDAEILMSAR